MQLRCTMKRCFWVQRRVSCHPLCFTGWDLVRRGNFYSDWRLPWQHGELLLLQRYCAVHTSFLPDGWHSSFLTHNILYH